MGFIQRKKQSRRGFIIKSAFSFLGLYLPPVYAKNIKKYNPPINAYLLGLRDNGKDQSDILKLILIDNRDVYIESGVYVINLGGIVIPKGVGKRVIGHGSVVFSINIKPNIDFLVLNKAVSFENIVFDFNGGSCKNGILYKPNCGYIKAKKITFRNLTDKNNIYGTIIFYIDGNGNVFDIDTMSFINIKKLSDGSIGNQGGNLTGIYICKGTKAIGKIFNVSARDCHNVNEDGAIIYEDVSIIYIITDEGDNGNSIHLENIVGYNFGKRLIKIHASNVSIRNVTGKSFEGDSLGVITFLSGEGLGDKTGCSAVNVKAFGKMEYAFSSSASGTYWKDLVINIMGGTKDKMTKAAFGIIIAADNNTVENIVVDAPYCIGIGSQSKSISNVTISNVDLIVNKKTVSGISDMYNHLGVTGLRLDNIRIQSIFCRISPIVIQYSKFGRTISNIVIRNIRIVFSGYYSNAYGAIYFDGCNNINLQKIYIVNQLEKELSSVITVLNSKSLVFSDIHVAGFVNIVIYFDGVENARIDSVFAVRSKKLYHLRSNDILLKN